MNFDKLKDDWNKNEPVSTEVSENMLKLKEASTPIDQLRKKMKYEFFGQLISLILLAFIPKLIGFTDELKNIYILFYAIICGFMAYYFFKFYRFYKHSYDLSLDSRKNLLWFYYEMRLNLELYKSLTYIVGFILLAFSAIALFTIKSDLSSKILAKMSITYIAINAVVTIVIIGVITELWATSYYGKYLKRIKIIVDSIDEE
ncbi:hypothetical protein [Pedobacter xixiisoli]|uniref:Uncharacterized protein n=1 Tax=Pedobacter xixiisoli TaxID=1476464 RepID=A0A285ZY20_9SPHI|nr:hypothetical protein [Pedobacter xixiisoli]SOD14545.1 hypothetical protein SAMN06297358_1628 [Pedobacter xixiisoli]